MLGNYHPLQMDTLPLLIHPNFATFLLPSQPTFQPIQHSPSNIFEHTPSPMADFSVMKIGSNLPETPMMFSSPIAPSFTQLPSFQPAALSIPDMVSNPSGFNYLSTYGQNFNPFIGQQQPPVFNMANGWTQEQQKLSELLKAMIANSNGTMSHSQVAPPDMPMLSPLLPGVGSTMPSFATLPLVSGDGVKDLQPSTQPPTITNTNYLQIPSPPILEQQIPQDPTTTATIFTSSITNCDQMPSSTSNSFEMSPFHSIFDLLVPKKPSQFDELSLMGSAPSSPPVLTRVDENPMECDDPNPPSLKPEISDHPEYGQNTEDFDLLLPLDGPPKLDQSEQLVEPILEDSNSSTEDCLNNTDTSSSDSEPSSKESHHQFNFDEEPLLDSLEALRKFSDELKLSSEDWLEIMTESRRRRLRPSTQANTVATLAKITGNTKTAKNGRKLRSSGSSERDVPQAKMAKIDHQYNEQESENQAPTQHHHGSKSDLYSLPISIDVDFCKSSHENSTPSSSGISSASNLSDVSSKSKWKVLRRSKNSNILWLGSQQEFNEEQKENLFSDEGHKAGRRRHTIGCKKVAVKKPKRIKSNWLPIGEAGEKLVRTCNDASPVLRECYTSIKHRYETDEVIKLRDCIKVRSAEGLENIGKVLNFYVDENGVLMASVLWYYTREQIEMTKNQLLNPLHEKELLASRHIDHIACDTIESAAFVLTFNEYCRYITEGQIDSLPVCLRPLESQEIWARGEENYPRRLRLPHEDTPFEVVYFSRRVYDIKNKRVYVPKSTSSITLRPTRSTPTRPIRASSH